MLQLILTKKDRRILPLGQFFNTDHVVEHWILTTCLVGQSAEKFRSHYIIKHQLYWCISISTFTIILSASFNYILINYSKENFIFICGLATTSVQKSSLYRREMLNQLSAGRHGWSKNYCTAGSWTYARFHSPNDEDFNLRLYVQTCQRGIFWTSYVIRVIWFILCLRF